MWAEGQSNSHLTIERLTHFTLRLTPKTRQNGNPFAGVTVMKKNYWDDETGLNVFAIVQSASEVQKREVFEFLKQYFGESR